MTERRQGQERNAQRAGPNAGRPHQPAAEEDALLGLQQLAGNRAVADLLAGPHAASPLPSAGLHVRDLLRTARSPAPATVQRQPLDEKEQASWDSKAAGSEKAASAEKGASTEDASWDEKASADKSAWDLEPASAEKSVGDDKSAWDDKSARDDESASVEKTWDKGAGEKAGGSAGTARVLAVGSAGPSVVRLQGLLVQAGFAVTPDGSFGPRTRAAVVVFQADRGLAPDGIVGPMTWSALETPGVPGGTAVPGGLIGPGEMELVEPGAGMEKQGSSGPGAGEATLPDESALEKKEGEPSGSKGSPW